MEVDSCDEKDENLGSGAEAAEHCEHPTLGSGLVSNRASLE